MEPTIFLIYINNLSSLILPQGKISWSEVFAAAENGFNIVNDWLQNNLLTLNTEKLNLLLPRYVKLADVVRDIN